MSATLWSRTGRFAQVDSDDRIVVLALTDLDRGTSPVALDGVGQLVWELLEHPRTGAQLVDELRRIEPDHDLTEPELIGFLSDLAAAGVVVSG